MALFQNDPFPGTNYSLYQNWERVVDPNGQVYYVIPNNPGYVYDPVASNATGRHVIRRNPRQQFADEQQQRQDIEEQRKQQREAAKQQAFNQSPLGQLLPVAGTVGGTVLASHLMPAKEANALEIALANKINAETAALGGNTQAAAAAAQGATNVASPVAGDLLGASAVRQVPAVNGGVPGIGPVGDGGQSVANIVGETGFFNTPVESLGGITPMQGLGAVGAALGAYQAFKGVESGNPFSAGMGGLGMGLGLNSMGLALGPWGWAAMAAPALLAATGVFDHKSTKEYQAERWGGALERGDITEEQLAAFGHAADDDSIYDEGPRKGQTWSYENALADAQVDPRHFAGVLGNFETFGSGWATIPPSQRDTIVKALVDENLYTNDHGDILIAEKDKARAKEIYDEVMGGGVPLLEIDQSTPFGWAVSEAEETAPLDGEETQANAAASSATKSMPPRSKTLSPGIDMYGNRISY